METQIIILTLIFVIGALIGMCFLEENAKYTLSYIFLGVIWWNFTFYWWASPMLKKFFHQ